MNINVCMSIQLHKVSIIKLALTADVSKLISMLEMTTATITIFYRVIKFPKSVKNKVWTI